LIVALISAALVISVTTLSQRIGDVFDTILSGF
jgi:Flp pilus assembly pilin Flp